MNIPSQPSSSRASRREFLKVSAGAAASLAALTTGMTARSSAAGSDRIRMGLIGCGDQGTTDALSFLKADKGAQIVAMADIVPAQMDAALQAMSDWCVVSDENPADRIKISRDHMFTGFDGYKKLLAVPEVDVVLIVTPVMFHPLHLMAAVEAGKHVFVEKPAAVDPPGARKVIEAGEIARKKGLTLACGTQRRHSAIFRRNYDAVMQGAIGPIRAGRLWWLAKGSVPDMTRKPGEDDAHYMARPDTWYSFVEMCGDHIVEQHVHNLDVANWFIGRPPVMALGFGARTRRPDGNRYDFFSVDYDYGDGVIVHSMCRHIPGCYNRQGEELIGATGTILPRSEYKGPLTLPEYEEIGGAYVQEQRDLIRSIREGKPYNEARDLAESTMTAIMGRISAYTGAIVRFSDLARNAESPVYNLQLTPAPEDFEKGTVVAPREGVYPLPGEAPSV